MVDKSQLDPELLVALENNPDFDLFDDLVKTRKFASDMGEKFNAHKSIMDHVVFEDHRLTDANGNPDLPVKLYRPKNCDHPLPAVLWMHGGGYVMGGIDYEVGNMQRLVDNSGCVVVAVDYRLAPEHPYPAPLDDCYQALSWMFTRAAELGIDDQKIAIAGISAGGGLAAALALMARDRGEHRICYQLLMCPMLDDRNDYPSSHMDLTDIGWHRNYNQKGWQTYLAGQYDAEQHTYAAPARIDDLSGLPPAYISVGELDLFLDEDLQYARRLMAANVRTELHVFPGAIHGFEYNVPKARVSSRAHYLNFDILKHVFS